MKFFTYLNYLICFVKELIEREERKRREAERDARSKAEAEKQRQIDDAKEEAQRLVGNCQFIFKPSEKGFAALS